MTGSLESEAAQRRPVAVGAAPQCSPRWRRPLAASSCRRGWQDPYCAGRDVNAVSDSGFEGGAAAGALRWRDSIASCYYLDASHPLLSAQLLDRRHPPRYRGPTPGASVIHACSVNRNVTVLGPIADLPRTLAHRPASRDLHCHKHVMNDR